MKEFLSEFWLWILIPVLVVAAAVVFLVVWGGGDSASPFTYDVF
jgi:hypothetical protein